MSKPASQITRKIVVSQTPSAPAMATMPVKASTILIPSLVDGRDEVEQVLVINPV